MLDEKISIIVPIFNTDFEFLKQCLDSLLNQTYSNIEIILINDGSTNDCAHFCDNYAKLDSRIRIFHQENAGVSSARNNGMNIASGKWIMFVDPDDWIELDTCRNINQILISNPSVDLVMWEYSVGHKVYTNGYDEVTEFNDKEKDLLILQILGVLEKIQIGDRLFSLTAPTVWKACYNIEKIKEEKLHFFEDLDRGEDILFNLYFIQLAYKILYLDRPFYHYRPNEASVTIRYNFKIDESHELFANRLEEFCYLFDKKIPDDLVTQKIYNSYLISLSSKYFHLDNPLGIFENRKQWLEFATQMKYVSTFRNLIERKNLNYYNRLVVFLSLYKQYFLLQFLYSVRGLLKTFRNLKSLLLKGKSYERNN